MRRREAKHGAAPWHIGGMIGDNPRALGCPATGMAQDGDTPPRRLDRGREEGRGDAIGSAHSQALAVAGRGEATRCGAVRAQKGRPR